MVLCLPEVQWVVGSYFFEELPNFISIPVGGRGMYCAMFKEFI